MLSISLLANMAIASVFDENKVPHLIIFVHGLGSDENAFGIMPEKLPTDLNKISHEYNYSGHVFKYETKNDEKVIKHFSYELAEFVKETVRSQGLTDDDDFKISIVAHSQGSLITMSWFYFVILNRTEFYPQVRKHLNTVVTIGGPFWGSKFATLIKESLWGGGYHGFQFMKKHFPSALGPAANAGNRQILDMALGSDMIQVFRRNFSKLPQYLLRKALGHLRILNISGNANLKRLGDAYNTTGDNKPECAVTAACMLEYAWYHLQPTWMDFLLNFGFGVKEWESDSIVSIPSSTVNSIYASVNYTDYEDGELIDQYAFKERRFADRLIVRGVHASSDADSFFDLAYVPEYCRDDLLCRHPNFDFDNWDITQLHPTYNYIYRYFLGEQLPEFAPNIKPKNFGGFTIGVNVRLPEGYEHLRDNIRVGFPKECTEPLSKEERLKKPVVKVMDGSMTMSLIAGDPKLELYSRSVISGDRYPDSKYFYVTGHVIYTQDGNHPLDIQYRNEGTTIKIDIMGKGIKTRHVEALVRPTLSTYLDIVVVPEDEYLNSDDKLMVDNGEFPEFMLYNQDEHDMLISDLLSNPPDYSND